MRIFLILFAVIVLGIFGFGSTSNACEQLRKLPELYEMFINKNAEGMKELGKLKIIAVTPVGDPRGNTYLFVKSRVEGEIDLYLLQETDKNCEVTDQEPFIDYSKVKKIIKQKGMKEL